MWSGRSNGRPQQPISGTPTSPSSSLYWVICKHRVESDDPCGHRQPLIVAHFGPVWDNLFSFRGIQTKICRQESGHAPSNRCYRRGGIYTSGHPEKLQPCRKHTTPGRVARGRKHPATLFLGTTPCSRSSLPTLLCIWSKDYSPWMIGSTVNGSRTATV